MNKEKAIKVIEDLMDYAFDEWDEFEYEKELEEIEAAVDFIKELLSDGKTVGEAVIDGRKYLITEVK